MLAFLIEGGTRQDRRSQEGHHLISPSVPVAAIIQVNINNVPIEG